MLTVCVTCQGVFDARDVPLRANALRGERVCCQCLKNKRVHFGDPLSVREWQIIAQLEKGSLNKHIAYDLGIKESSLRVWISEILRKTGKENRTQLAIWGYIQRTERERAAEAAAA